MSVLICGSIAYDTIMVFPDRFRQHILPEQLHILNVAFLVPDMRKEFGGCAGNIAYNMRLLKAQPLVMATVGEDAQEYLQRMDALGLRRDHVRQIEGAYTAQAFITTDLDDNQITAFHPGAMNEAHRNRIDDAEGVTLGIVAPDGRDGMLQHAEQFAAAGVPFFFDPGQGLPMFDGDELRHFVKLANYCAVNDYEAKMLCDRTGWTLEQLAEQVEALIVTRGGEGSHIFAEGRRMEIPAVAAPEVVDPTGCGDAYRAGLLYARTKGYDWERAGRLASVMGAIKIAHRGGQNHRPERAEIERMYESAFGEKLC